MTTISSLGAVTGARSKGETNDRIRVITWKMSGGKRICWLSVD